MFKIPEEIPTWFNKKIEVRETETMGLGVYASEDIKKYEVFERAPVLVFSPEIFKIVKDAFDGRNHILHSYAFNWKAGMCCIVWGYGSMYNHSNTTEDENSSCNASYRMHTKIPCVEYFAKRDIKKGEEIMIHYLRGRTNIDFFDDGSWFESGGTIGKQGSLSGMFSDWSGE